MQKFLCKTISPISRTRLSPAISNLSNNSGSDKYTSTDQRGMSSGNIKHFFGIFDNISGNITNTPTFKGHSKRHQHIWRICNQSWLEIIKNCGNDYEEFYWNILSKWHFSKKNMYFPLHKYR